MSYTGEERRDDIKDIRDILSSMSENKKVVNKDGWQVNKNVPAAFLLTLIISVSIGFKSIALAFADIDSNKASIKEIIEDSIAQPVIDSIIYKQAVEMKGVSESISALKKTQDKFSAKLEKISDKQQENYQSLRDLIISQSVAH